MANKWLTKLQNFEEAVVGDYNPHEHVLKTSSPSLNFMFGKGHGLPLGLTLALGGYPKGGKTLVGHMFTGQCHADYPDGMVVKYDSEYRTEGQSTPEERQKMWGIDPERLVTYETNNPMKIFDHIEGQLSAMCQDGMPLKLVIIDSVNSIQGRRAMNADTVETQQIGDDAKTLGDGFKRILAVQRKHKFALIFTCQIRAEMDLLEQKRGNKVKMSLPFALQHYAEYFMFVEKNRNKEGRTDLMGNEFKDDNLGDIADNADNTGHKIRLKMKDSSCGPIGRTGEYTFDRRKGLINTWEEIYTLGVNRGIIVRPNNLTYEFAGQTWRGAPKAMEAVRSDPGIQQQILNELYARDAAGVFDAEDKAAALAVDE